MNNDYTIENIISIIILIYVAGELITYFKGV